MFKLLVPLWLETTGDFTRPETSKTVADVRGAPGVQPRFLGLRDDPGRWHGDHLGSAQSRRRQQQRGGAAGEGGGRPAQRPGRRCRQKDTNNHQTSKRVHERKWDCFGILYQDDVVGDEMCGAALTNQGRPY